MSRNAKILLTMSALFSFAIGLSGIFVNVFIWKKTNSFTVIAIYNLVNYIFTPITFVLAGILAKKKNGIGSLRIGLLIYALFYTLILFAGSREIAYICFLGVVHGMATGFYWLAFNTLSFDFTDINNRDTFNGFNGSFSGVTAAVAPVTSAYIISRFHGINGYRVVFLITFAIFLLLVLISIVLKCENCCSDIDFKRVFSGNCEEWKIIRKATVFWGFRDVIIIFLVNILIIETTKSELSLGKFALIASLISSASYMLVQKIIKPSRRRFSILIGTLGSFLAICGLLIKISYNTLFTYITMDAFFLPFFTIQLSSSAFNVINRAHEENMRIEYVINKDLMLNTGRVISLIILITLLTTFKNTSILKFYLAFIGLAPIVSGYFLGKLKEVLEGICK